MLLSLAVFHCGKADIGTGSDLVYYRRYLNRGTFAAQSHPWVSTVVEDSVANLTDATSASTAWWDFVMSHAGSFFQLRENRLLRAAKGTCRTIVNVW